MCDFFRSAFICFYILNLTRVFFFFFSCSEKYVYRCVGLKAREIRHICDLAGPLLVSYMSANAMTATDQSIVGHLTTEIFTAMNLANALMFGSLALSTGIMNGLCTLAAQAFGAKKHRMVVSIY